eukprot:Rmarinus@m.16339
MAKVNEVDEFARKLVEVSCAQIVASAGFTTAEKTAIRMLSDLMERYIMDIGQNAQEYAEHAGRSECNFDDVTVCLLEDLSVNARALRHFYAAASELDPVKLVPKFPVRAAVSKKRRREAEKVVPSSDEVPDFLPSFPPSHTFVNTPTYDSVLQDIQTQRKVQTKQQRQAERSLEAISGPKAKTRKR